MPSPTATHLAAALGDELSQSEASFRVFATAGGLAVLGLGLLLFTIWWWRGTRPEPPALGPLEVMSERRWHAASDSERRRLVDVHRPSGSLDPTGRPAPQPIDLSVLAREMPSSFDDLREDGPASSSEPVASPAAGGSVDGGEAAPALFELGPLPESEPQLGVEAPVLDDTMFEVERPGQPPGDERVNGARHVEYEQLTIDEPVAEQDDRPSRSDELAIDPLLQRTASQD